jgi:hypothetical protein
VAKVLHVKQYAKLSADERRHRNELRRLRRARIAALERNAHKVIKHNERAPDSVLVEREQRQDALRRRTTSQIFFGDPAPGYSALDRRTKA